MKSILSWFNTPYYFNPNLLFKVKISFYLGLFVFLFLYVFKPFSLTILGDLLLEYTLIIGLSAFIGSFFMLFFPPLIFKNYFNEDNWTIGKNIFLVFISLFIIGSIIWYFSVLYKSDKGILQLSYFRFLIYTFLVGLIPVLFVVFYNEKNIRIKREKNAEKFNTLKQEKLLSIKKTLDKNVTIYSSNNKEKLEFNVDKLVYISSQGNYASFFFINKENSLKEKILRITLTKIDKDLEDYKNIIRCHKSYIINAKFIDSISGNARGYLLSSHTIPHQIPVSRSFNKRDLKDFI